VRVALALALVAGTASAGPLAPPRLRLAPGTEVELPARGASSTIEVAIAIPDSREEPDAIACRLVQGARHRDSTEQHGFACTIALVAGDRFAAGPARFELRVSRAGAWSAPAIVEVELAVPGTLVNLSAADGAALVTSQTRTAAVAGGMLSFPLWSQNPNGGADEPAHPYLGRVALRVPASGLVDAIVPIAPRWLAPLAVSPGWRDSAGVSGAKLLAVKAVHVTGTYNPAEGARLIVSVPGDDDLGDAATVQFRPPGYDPKRVRDCVDALCF